MAERIIDMPTAKMATDLRFWLRECIVLCRDCRYYDEIIHACDHPCITPLRGDCPENWIFSCFDNDFCSWGKRKEVDE